MNEKNPLEGLEIGLKPKRISTGIKGHYLKLGGAQWPVVSLGVYVKNKQVGFLPCTSIEVVKVNNKSNLYQLDLYQNDIKVANLEGINTRMKEEIESYLSLCEKFYEIFVIGESDEEE